MVGPPIADTSSASWRTSRSRRRRALTVVESAARRRLPATYESRDFVEIGGLMSYGPSFPDMYRSRSNLRRQDPPRREARRPPRRPSHEVRAGHQPQDRPSPRPDHPALAPAAGGSGDRLGQAQSAHAYQDHSPFLSPPRMNRQVAPSKPIEGSGTEEVYL